MELLIYSALGLTGFSAAGLAAVYFLYPTLLLKAYSRYMLYSSALKEKRVVSGSYAYCYAEQGDQSHSESTLLFLHGMGGEKEAWIPLLKLLPKDVHVIVLDMPGHGGTNSLEGDDLTFAGLAARLHEFVLLTNLRDRKLHLVGQSLGGSVAAAYARFYPQQVVMLSMACPVMKTPEDNTEFSKAQKEGKNPLTFDSLEDMEWLLRNGAHEPIEVPRQILKAMFSTKKSSKQFYERVLAQVATSQDMFLEKHMQQIMVPTQVLWGEQDKLIDKSGMAVLTRGLPRCTASRLISNCGHMVQLEQPGPFAEALMDLRRTVHGYGGISNSSGGGGCGGRDWPAACSAR